MKIGIVATHNWPVPYKSHTGDHFYALLARGLDELGHEVTFFAPDGSYVPPHGQQLTMPCSWGSNNPSSNYCEYECFNKYADVFRSQDIIHDFSISQEIVVKLHNEGYKNTISQRLGGNWSYPIEPHNVIVASEAMRQRALRGASDHENTRLHNLVGAGQLSKPLKEAHVVNHGIDTDFYTPTYNKGNFFLWLGRWHTVRGYDVVIQLAKETGIELVMAGEHPDREVGDKECVDYQKSCCLEALRLAGDAPNIHFEWLPADPYHHEVKRDLIRSAKALLFPVQFHEPFGLMQAEALACGTPVIGTNYGSVPEVIINGVTGYVVNNSVQDFANVLGDVDKIIPAICREQAVKRFDYKVMTQNYLREYNLVIEGKHW